MGEGGLGTLHEEGGIDVGGPDGSATAECDSDAGVLEFNGRCEESANLAEECLDLDLRAIDDEGDFIAAPAADHQDAAECSNALGDGTQDAVSAGAAVEGVDGAEAVDVDDDCRERRAVGGLRVEPLDKGGSVERAGLAVESERVAELALLFAGLGPVSTGDDGVSE